MRKFLAGAAVIALTLPVAVLAQGNIIPPNPSGAPAGGGNGIYGILQGILTWAFTILGVLGVLAFVIAGLLYLTAAGDENRIKSAKSAMVFAIVGIVVGLVGYIVLGQIMTLLGA